MSRSPSEVVFPNVRQENGAGSVVQYEHCGIGLGDAKENAMSTMTPEFEAAKDILCTLLQRPDRGLFNYDEMADMAFEYTRALERRFQREQMERQANRASVQITTMQAAITKLTPNLLANLGGVPAKSSIMSSSTNKTVRSSNLGHFIGEENK